MRLWKRSELVIWILSLVLGFAGTCFYAEHAGLPDPVRTEYAAWWGGLYPEYCLPGAMEKIETETEAENGRENGRKAAQKAEQEAGEEPAPVKIRFKYLTFLNE